MGAIYDVSNVDPDALSLKTMMDSVLEKVTAVFTSYSVPLPSRCYWTMGAPAIDCEQLVVSFVQMYLGTPGDQAATPQRCHMPRTAVLTISIAREIPAVGLNGRPPTAEKIEAGSALSAVDAWILMDSMKQFDPWDDTSLGIGVIATVDAATAEGGFQVVNMQISMVVP
jgi:hypothetical protein